MADTYAPGPGINWSPNYGKQTALPNGFNYQPYPQQYPQQQSQPNSQGGLMTIFVQSEDEVSHYPVAAGLTVLLISFNLKKFWLKGTSTSGIPQQLRTFTFDETTPAQNQNGTEGVTRKEFNALSEKLDKLLSELGGVKE